MKKSAIIFIISILVTITCSTKTTSSKDPEAIGIESDNDSKYYSLVAQVKRQKRGINYTDLRLAYAKASFYNPYETDLELDDSMRESYDQGDYEKAIHYADQILEKNFVYINAHMVCAMAYEKIGDRPKSDFHNSIAMKLIESILESGDGNSPETAYRVVMIKEEYVILNMFCYKLQKQALIELNNSYFDKMEVINEETQEAAALYFNIDLPMSWWRKRGK